MKLGSTSVILHITGADIATGVCGNRAHCVVAQAIDRQFGLRGKGYIRVDAWGWAATLEGMRYDYRPSRLMPRYLRKFDELGAKHGVAAARQLIKPTSFHSKLIEIRPVNPTASPARKAQINARRNAKAAEERALGITPTKRMPRYAGI